MTSYSPLHGRACECSVCGRRFGGVEAFDTHRVGHVSVRVGEQRRRCMTDEEMITAGLQHGDRGWGRLYSTARTSRIGGTSPLAA